MNNCRIILRNDNKILFRNMLEKMHLYYGLETLKYYLSKANITKVKANSFYVSQPKNRCLLYLLPNEF